MICRPRALLVPAVAVLLVLAAGRAVPPDEAPRRSRADDTRRLERPTPVRSASFDRPALPPSTGVAAADALRIRAQLRRVERRLRRRARPGLTPRQRRRRARTLDRLREYRTRGLYPVNTDFPGRRVPYFVDRRGTLCALAHLVWSSGHENLVATVAARRNNAYVRRLASSPRLREWLREHGLSPGEAAMIQPAYGGDAGLTVADPVEPEFVVASAVGTGLAAWTGTASAVDVAGGEDVSDLAGAAGVLSGAATAVLGATRLDTEGASLAIGVVDAAVGTAAAALGTASLLAGGRTGGGTARHRTTQRGPGLSLRPYARTASGPRPGVGVTLRF